MKVFFLSFVVIFSFYASTYGIETNVSRSDSLPTSTWNGVSDGMETNLTAMGDYGDLVTQTMLRTNAFKVYLGLSQTESGGSGNRFVSAPICKVYVYNRTTNFIQCLRLPNEITWSVRLFDKNGRQVAKTESGRKFSNRLSEDQVAEWFRKWNHRRLSRYIVIYPNGDPRYSDPPTDFGGFWLNELFEIKRDGEYELRVRVRIVQAAKDKSGKIHFIQIPLPEATAKFQISSNAVVK